jgi:hypothetical protein
MTVRFLLAFFLFLAVIAVVCFWPAPFLMPDFSFFVVALLGIIVVFQVSSSEECLPRVFIVTPSCDKIDQIWQPEFLGRGFQDEELVYPPHH